MPNDKKDMVHPGDDEKRKDEQIAALLLEIQQEMDSMTLKELERLYAVVALLEKKID